MWEKMTSKTLLTVLVILVVFTSPGIAGEDVELEDVVVTATKTEKRVEDAPGSVTSISRHEIELREVKTVDDALKELKGVFAKRNKGLMDTTSSVRLRGFKYDQYTLILLDGQPLNDGYTGGVDWGTLPMDNIERIEVIRGAASALYGGNAMGGVINIITKTPQRPEVMARAGYGTNNSQRFRFGVGGRLFDKLSLRVGYERESTDGYVTKPILKTIKAGTGTETGGYSMKDKYGEPTQWVVGDAGENSAEKSGFNAKASLDFSDTRNLAFTTVLGRHEYDYGPPNTYMGTFEGSAAIGADKKAGFGPNDFISYTGIGENKTDTYTLAYKDLVGSIGINLQLGTVRVYDRYTLEAGKTETYYDSPGSLKVTESESWFSEVRADVPVSEAHLLTSGVSFRMDKSDTNDHDVPYYRSYADKGDSTFYSGGKDRIWSLFLQDEWNIVKTLTLYAGCRYDSFKVSDGASGEPGSKEKYDSNTESEFSPKVGLVWKALPDTTIRTSVGHAFRAPNLYELYRTWASWGWEYRSNPKLGPETVWTYEAEVDQYLFSKKTRLSLTGYRNDIKGLIYYEVDEEAKTKTRVNAGKARTNGLEFEASQEITGWLKARVNYTYTDAKITDNPMVPESEGKRVTGIPTTMSNIGLDARYRWFKGSLGARYFSKIYNDPANRDTGEGVYGTYEPAFLLDTKITFTPVKWVDVSISVNNILDKEYYEYYPSEGRTFLCELSARY